MASFLTPELKLVYVDGRFWDVDTRFAYAVGAPNGKTIVEVERGFRTDFASIPRMFWSWMPPTGWYGKIAVIHDKLYQDGKIGDMVIDQKYADDVLNEGMCVLAAQWVLEHGLSKPNAPQIPHGALRTLIERDAIYWGVRLGGRFTWNKYRKEDK
jgi:hypothetical protein